MRQLEVPFSAVADTFQGVTVHNHDRVGLPRRRSAEHVDATESERRRPLTRMTLGEVDKDRSGRIGGRDLDAADPERNRRVRLQAAGECPGPRRGGAVAHRGVSPGRGEGEDEAEAAVEAVAERQEVTAELGGPDARLDVRAADMDYAQVAVAAADEGVHFAEESVELRAFAARELHDVFRDVKYAVPRNPPVANLPRKGGRHRKKKDQCEGGFSHLRI